MFIYHHFQLGILFVAAGFGKNGKCKHEKSPFFPDEGSNESPEESEHSTKHDNNEHWCRFELQNGLRDWGLSRLTGNDLSCFDNSFVDDDYNERTTSSTMSAKTSKTINYTDTKFVTETGDEKCGFELRVVDMPTKVPAEALGKMLTPPQLEDAKQILLAAQNEAIMT